MNNLSKRFSRWSQNSSIVCVRSYQRIRPGLDQVLITIFGFVSSCKHQPTCSDYMIDQIRTHGTIAGVRRGVTRILNCR